MQTDKGSDLVSGHRGIRISTQFVVQDWSGVDLSRWGIVIVFLFWLPARWIGRPQRQLRDPSEIPDVESLFDLARNRDGQL